MATHSSILAWRIPMNRGAWLAGYSPWGHKELDTTEQLSIGLILVISDKQWDRSFKTSKSLEVI